MDIFKTAFDGVLWEVLAGRQSREASAPDPYVSLSTERRTALVRVTAHAEPRTR
jgi:hypothetical protein